MIPVPVRVPLTTRGPVIVVLAALTSNTFVPYVAVSPFREISFLAVKVAKEHSIMDPKNDTSKLSLNQTLGPDVLLDTTNPVDARSVILALFMFMLPLSVTLRMSVPFELMTATLLKAVVCKFVELVTLKAPSV